MPRRSEVDSRQAADACGRVAELDEAVWQAWQSRNRANDVKAVARRLIAVKWFCIALLLLMVGLWTYAAEYQFLLRPALTAGAVILALEAARAHRYGFAGIFAGVVWLYNPAVPVFALSGNWHLVIVLASIIPFATSLIQNGASEAAV